MCLILFAYRVHPVYKLIVAANRDEFYDRPAEPAHFWPDHPYILAGRDLLKMGTWMGVTTTGRFAAVTNFRNPADKRIGLRSRGNLAAEFLKMQQLPRIYLREVAKDRDLYPGYNLLAGDKNDLYYYSNVENKPRLLSPGIYGLSNHLLDTPWPKVIRGKRALESLINTPGEISREEIFHLLQDAQQAPDEELPHTGVSLEWEKALSSIFIHTGHYGTRSSTVIFMTEDLIDFEERVYASNAEIYHEERFSVHI